MTGQDSLKTRRTLNVNGKAYDYFSVEAAGEALGVDFSRLPYSMKVLLENLLRYEDGVTVTTEDIQALADWQKERKSPREIAYMPARVLMQDFTGVPAIVDLAAMRDAMAALGGDPERAVHRTSAEAARRRARRSCCPGHPRPGRPPRVNFTEDAGRRRRQPVRRGLFRHRGQVGREREHCRR